ncbi:MAG TPA: UDP-N-acetylmuramate dehydrogenase, partial [Flavisolibacter sp.]|nr:UDP-N-acetylmuramate dehydrogenase [Flavisolibacter sp.]
MQIWENISLRPYNTFGIDVDARYFASFSSLIELKDLLNAGLAATHKKLILGGGSNILLTKNFDGIVLKNEIGGIDVVNEDEDYIYVKAGAGVNWHRLVMHCVDNGFAGLENLSLIPGNVGASPMQNIGAYGVEIKDVFHQLEAFHINDQFVKNFSLDECGFGYRESVFKHQYKGQFVITGVTYRLSKKPRFHTSYGAIQQELEKMGVQELSIKAISQAVINIRTSKLPDPKEVGNAGSFFKNPVVPQSQFAALQNEFPFI